MPDFIDHIHQYKHNQACARHLLDTPYIDWAVTAAFYSALHILDAGLIDQSIFCPSSFQNDTQHAWRKRQSKDIFGDKCFRAYRKLYEASKRARYLEGNSYTVASIPAIAQFLISDIHDYINLDLQIVLNEVDKKCGNIK